VGAGDEQGEVLVLLVVAVKQRQLLLPMGRIIDGIEVQEQLPGRYGEAGDELVDQHIPQALQGGDRDGVLPARQGRLAGQGGVGRLASSGLVGRRPAASLKVASVRRASWSCWSS